MERGLQVDCGWMAMALLAAFCKSGVGVIFLYIGRAYWRGFHIVILWLGVGLRLGDVCVWGVISFGVIALNYFYLTVSCLRGAMGWGEGVDLCCCDELIVNSNVYLYSV